MAAIGELVKQGDSRFLWKIPFNLLRLTRYPHRSPNFFHADVNWYIILHSVPNRNVALYVVSKDFTEAKPAKVKCSLSILRTQKKPSLALSGTVIFKNEKDKWGSSNFVSCKHLIKRKSEFAPEGILTVGFYLKEIDSTSKYQSYW